MTLNLINARDARCPANMSAYRIADSWRLRGTVSALVLATLTIGCRCNPEFSEVQGTVTLDGKPLEGVEIAFMPDPECGTKGPNSSSYTDKDGKFKLRCDKANRDGAAVGPHRVCIIDIGAVAIPSKLPGLGVGVIEAKKGRAPRGRTARLASIYNTPAQSPLRANVKPGGQTLDFHLRTEGIK